jgi:hypothetical protein
MLHLHKTEGDGAMNDFTRLTEDFIVTWHGVYPPNDPGRRLAAELEATIRAFERLRGTLRFEDEPSSFENALLATREGA